MYKFVVKVGIILVTACLNKQNRYQIRIQLSKKPQEQVLRPNNQPKKCENFEHSGSQSRFKIFQK